MLKYLLPYLNFIKENRRIYKLIHNRPHIFRKQVTFQRFYDQIFSKILDKYEIPKSEQEYMFTYFSFGLVAVIQKWIEKDCDDDIDTIANIMKKVIGYES